MTQTIIKIPAAGAFDPTDIVITDDTSGAFLIKDDAGSPHEYMRIDTTNGSEKTIFKTQSGANTGFFVSVPTVGNVLGITRGGSPTTKAFLNMGTTLLQVDSDKILNDLVSDSKTFKVDGTSVSPLVITGDSNATFTLDTANNAVFKVQDNLASPTQFLTIDSNTSSESIKLALTPANADRFFEMTSSKIHARCQNSQINMGTNGIDFTGYDDFDFGQYGAGKKLRFKDNQTAEERFSVDKESNATFTLDDSSAATFEVKHASMTTTYNQFFKAQEGVGAVITPGDGSSWQLNNNSTAANLNDRLIFHLYQNSYLEQHQMPKWYVGQRSTTSSAASSSLSYDARMGRTHANGHVLTSINSSYSGTHAFTAELTNTLSSFAGNQGWGVTSQILRFKNQNTSNGATLQFAVDVGGSIHFVNNSGITTGISNPVSGTQALAAKGSASAGTYSVFVYRLSQYNTLEGSASLYDDDRYIIELLYAELI